MLTISPELEAPHKDLPALFRALPNADGGKLKPDDYLLLSQKSGVALPKVTAWCKALKEAHEMKADPSKWTETCWRFLMYTTICFSMWVICWGKDWLWDTKLCWRGYPFISIEPEL